MCHYLVVIVDEPQAMTFVKTLLDMDKKSASVIDSRQNPITVKSLKGLMDKLVDAYTSATTEFDIENERLKKARNIKKIMDW